MITVLQSFPRQGPQTNPYLTQLVASMPPDVETVLWSWRAALWGRYDLVHLHWPEVLLRREDRLATIAHRTLFALLMLRVALTDVVIVRTLHNPTPHEAGSRIEGILLRWCDRLTGLWIALNDSANPTDSAGAAPDRASVVIAHGHYRDSYDTSRLPEPIPGRLLYFGLVRRYKGVLKLVTTFGALRDSDLSLRILGQPKSMQLKESITGASGADPRISTMLTYVPGEVLVREIGESELVVLPYARMHNSGAVLLALSLDRPVLVPESPATLALAREVGPEWLLTYRGPLEPQHLLNALGRVRSASRGARPDLSARDWPGLGIQHRDAYLAALTRG